MKEASGMDWRTGTDRTLASGGAGSCGFLLRTARSGRRKTGWIFLKNKEKEAGKYGSAGNKA